jgi:pyruvate dehydrogenase E1 component alpha subunit
MEPIRYLDEDGRPLRDPPVGTDRARELLAAMLHARVYDRKCSALQRQGRLATYAQFEGQEAAQIGAAAALRRDDWMVATYRDAAAMWHHGYPWENLLLGRMGDERGGAPPEDVPVLPPSITVGAHMLHAVGLGWAERLQGTDRVALSLFGDGATSEGDFHEAMNLAAVFTVPTVFVCENNGWAISMSREAQTRSETIAVKAVAYGMPGVLVDGNDVFAVFAAVSEAVERARAGGGPTLVEALTYRLGPHTTTDDARRYRSDEEVEVWRRRDPILRLRAYLSAAGEWSEAWEDDVEAEASAAMELAVEAAEALEPFPADGHLDRAFAEPTLPLRRQRSLLEGGDTDA